MAITTTNKITNRVQPCTCGCKGRDSQHAREFQRVVSDVVYLDAPEQVVVRAYRNDTLTAVARGKIELFGQVREVAFLAYKVQERWYAGGWFLL